jgi:hypothetical protein
MYTTNELQRNVFNIREVSEKHENEEAIDEEKQLRMERRKSKLKKNKQLKAAFKDNFMTNQNSSKQSQEDHDSSHRRTVFIMKY